MEPVGPIPFDQLVTDLCKCQSCKSVLEPPVILTKEQGNLCSSCYESLRCHGRTTDEAVENTPIISILERKRFTCMHEGCDEKYRHAELKAHQDICIFRTVHCVFFPNCIWNGRKTEFADHLLSTHNEHVISNDSDSFSVSISTKEDCDSVHILATTSGPFACRIKSDWTKRSIYCKIYSVLPDTVDSLKHNFSFKLCYEDNALCSLEFCCLIIDKHETLQSFVIDQATVVNINRIPASLLEGDFLTQVIKFADLNETIHMSSVSLGLLECPICNNLMRPPIYQCVIGHSVCSSCLPHLKICPTCRAYLGSTRNYTLEEIVEKIKYPCVYKDFGCQVITTNITTHETSCSFKRFNCPFTSCHFQERYKELMDHLMVTHKSFCRNVPHLSLRRPIDHYICRFFRVVWDHIFIISVSFTATTAFWGVEILTKQSGGLDFIYKVILTDHKRPDKKMVLSEHCHNMSAKHDEVFQKCITLPMSVAKAFIENRVLNCMIKISRKRS